MEKLDDSKITNYSNNDSNVNREGKFVSKFKNKSLNNFRELKHLSLFYCTDYKPKQKSNVRYELLLTITICYFLTIYINESLSIENIFEQKSTS